MMQSYSASRARSETEIASSELQFAQRYLEEARNELISATEGLSEQQWQFKPDPTHWSIAEIVEHVVIVSEFVLGPVRQRLAKAALGDASGDSRQVDEIIMNVFVDRSKMKVVAPESFQPAARWTPTAALERFVADCEQLNEYLVSTPDLRQRRMDSLPLRVLTNGEHQAMDGFQWVLAAAAHIRRHTEQILELKAHSKFPSTSQPASLIHGE